MQDDKPELPPGLSDEEPELPAGLSGEEPEFPAGLSGGEPELPPGLGGDEPELPSGLELHTSEKPGARSDTREASLPLGYAIGFDSRAGMRWSDAPGVNRVNLAEARASVDLSRSFRAGSSALHLAFDLLYDHAAEVYEPNLETGKGFFDLRAASFASSPWPWLDLKVGRQVLTWGTGDLLFIHDLFPKDWRSFLLGRDLDYLKAPSDALRASFYLGEVVLELVYTPRFDADRLPTRDRLRSWDPLSQRVVGDSQPLRLERRDEWFEDSEYAGRLYGSVASWEWALYGYHGFWKSPAGLAPTTGAATFPALSVYGASLRGAIAGTIVNGEVGYYDSRDDRGGFDPFVRNDETRVLLGAERQVVSGLTVGLQYYLEAMANFDAHKARSPAPATDLAEYRHLGTLRLRWSSSQQLLHASLFVYFSPSDRDGYLRPTVSYDFSDAIQLGAGANVFFGRDAHTFFGQLESNSNAYAFLKIRRAGEL